MILPTLGVVSVKVTALRGPGVAMGPLSLVLRRFISGRTMRNYSLADRRPKPWPYQEKGYSNLHCYLDMHTLERFDENSKVITIEGPPGIGKSIVAQKIAEELEMKYFPMVTTDSLYINCYGWDMRSIDHEVPPRTRCWDEARFFREPNHEQSFVFQTNKIWLKISQYFDALAHLLNTGQGVVMDRCIYSDLVFGDAMFKAGYIDKNEHKFYHKVYESCIKECIKPHLVIYLDCPVSAVESKLAAPARTALYPNEKSTVNTKFLEGLEESYKMKFLRDIQEHSELLIYDWAEPGDAEVIVEDIERIDFDVHDLDIHNPKMMDWRFRKDWVANERRWEFTHRKDRIINYIFMQNHHFDIPSLMLDSEDSRLKNLVLDDHPESGEAYAPGYNASKGDKGVLFKTKDPSPWQGLGTQSGFA